MSLRHHAVSLSVPLLASLVALVAAPAHAQDNRLEARLGGNPARLVIFGFEDVSSSEAGDCADQGEETLPCIEKVAWVDPPPAGGGLESPGQRYLDFEQYVHASRLVSWTLHDIAFRSTRPEGPTTVSLDEGLWGRGASRLPASSSIWTLIADPTDDSRLLASVPDRSVWRGGMLEGEPLCRSLVYRGDDGGSPATQPPIQVCSDGFVANFAEESNRPIPGDFYRHGPRGSGRRDNRDLLGEFLFITALGDAPPWANGNLYQTASLPTPEGGSSRYTENFIVPSALGGRDAARGGWQLDLAGMTEEEREAFFASFTTGTARVSYELGNRLLSYATETYNHTHVRTSMALAAMLRPPSWEDEAPEASSGGRNPGQLFERPIEAEEEEDEGVQQEEASRVNRITVQISALPLSLRWRWIGSLYPQSDLRREVDITSYSDSLPNDAIEEFRAIKAVAEADEPVIDPVLWERLQDALDDAQSRQVSEQLLGALLDEFGIAERALLFDHVMEDMGLALNSLRAWTPIDLEKEAIGRWEDVLGAHAYEADMLDAGGYPSNPLLVCAPRRPGGEEVESFQQVMMTALFEADAPEAETAWPLYGDDAYDLLIGARDQLPFVAIDGPRWTRPRIEPVALLPGGRAIYQVQWKVWSGWHLFWGAHPMEVGDPNGADGVSLRSGAICEDTLLVPAELEPTLARAALLRDFAGSQAWSLSQRAGAEGNPADFDTEDMQAVLDMQPVLGGMQRELADLADSPALRIRTALRERLANHRALSCDERITRGSLDHDDDGDGMTEFGGDCNDADPSFTTSERPALIVMADLNERELGDGIGGARTPYLRLRRGDISGAAQAVTFERLNREDEEAPRDTWYHVSPDRRPLQREDRWGRRYSSELTIGGSFGWSPYSGGRLGCNPDYQDSNPGNDSLGCSSLPEIDAADLNARDENGDLTPIAQLYRDHEAWRHGNQSLSWQFQVLGSIWDSAYARKSLDIGVEFHLNLALPESFANQFVTFQTRFGFAGTVIVGSRLLIPPTFRRGGGLPWGVSNRVGSVRPPFARTELGIHGGWMIGSGFYRNVQGGPLLELWIGEAVRRPASPRFASLTPYRPRLRIGGFLRANLLLPLDERRDDRANDLRWGINVMLGIRVRAGISLGKLEEPDIALESPVEVPEAPSAPTPPSIPGL